MHSITNDSWSAVISHLRYFTFSRFYQLKIPVRVSLLDLVDKIVSVHGRGADGLIVGLLRQIRPGDHGTNNRELTLKLIGILFKHRDWLHELPGVVPFVFYSMARIASEEGIDPSILTGSLKICDDLLRNRYKECIVIGRDFARLVFAISNHDPIKLFWSWFTKDGDTPKSAPIHQILAQPTPKKYIACRLTPVMESEIIYIMENVKVGRQNFYEAWFQDAHIPKGPSDDPNSVVVDLIRYIVAVHHPSNAVLASNVVQRWSVITWLYKLIIHEKAAFDALLSLYLDWLVFDPTVDSIMNIEPGCLVLTKGLSRLPTITLGALTYLMFYKHEFIPGMATSTLPTLDLAMRVCIEKGVITDLSGLLGSPLLDVNMKSIVGNLFPAASKMTVSTSSPSAPAEPLLDPRLRSATTSKVASSSSLDAFSSSASLMEAPVTSVDQEMKLEMISIKHEYAQLLMDKIAIAVSSNIPTDCIVELIEELKRIVEEISKESIQIKIAKTSIELDRFLSTLPSDIQNAIGFDLPQTINLPTTAAQFSKFKAQMSLETLEFPDPNDFFHLIEGSLTKRPTEQIWFWKSIVLMIQILPKEKLSLIKKCLRGAFELIADEREIMTTGMQDSLLALNERSPSIPAIFDGLERLTSDAFQNFVEQSILLSRND